MDKLDITRLTPHFLLADKNGWAMAKAIEMAMQIFFDKIQEGVDIALNPDKMPEWRLDELARDDNMFWYDFNAPLGVKREMVKNARSVYATLGTKAGTEQAARGYASDARIEEWFDYGGEAAYFRIRSQMPEAAENADAMVRSVNDVKRLSSVLEGIYIDLPKRRVKTYIGTALYNALKLRMRMADVDFDSLQSGCLYDETNVMLIDENGVVLTE